MAMKVCIPYLTKPCLESRVRVIKTIRAGMNVTETFLSNDPNFRLIHLVRDPRPVIMSRVRVEPKSYPKERLVFIARSFCSTVGNDLSAYTVFHRKYPRKTKLVRYEDMANRPLDYLEKLYSFASLTPSSSEHDAFWQMTSSNATVTEMAYSTTRSNSSFTALSWRLQNDTHTVQSTQQQCVETMARLGFRLFPNDAEMRNLSVPAFVATDLE